ncbi:MAG: hypothetical protein SGJ04_08495 [Bacteroidota bacterium]|nr:hypothetical protein [Bacteroidota bacterium]
MQETVATKSSPSSGRRGRNTTSVSARRRAAEQTATELMIERLRNTTRPTFAKTVEECVKNGKRPVQLSPTLIVFSDKTKEELLERYKHTNNLF